MSRHPFDPGEIERHEDHDPAAEELERYARTATSAPSRDFADRVMASVAAEPKPRRTLTAWFASLSAGRGRGPRFAQAGVLAATLVLTVGGVLAAGELARIVREAPNAGSSASPIVETQSPSALPTPTVSERPSPSGPEQTEVPSQAESPDASEAEQTSSPTGKPSPTSSEDDHGGRSETPHPTESPHPSED